MRYAQPLAGRTRPLWDRSALGRSGPGLGPVAEGVVVGGVVAGLGEASGVSRVVSSHHVIKPEASGAQDRRTR